MPVTVPDDSGLNMTTTSVGSTPQTKTRDAFDDIPVQRRVRFWRRPNDYANPLYIAAYAGPTSTPGIGAAAYGWDGSGTDRFGITHTITSRADAQALVGTYCTRTGSGTSSDPYEYLFNNGNYYAGAGAFLTWTDTSAQVAGEYYNIRMYDHQFDFLGGALTSQFVIDCGTRSFTLERCNFRGQFTYLGSRQVMSLTSGYVYFKNIYASDLAGLPASYFVTKLGANAYISFEDCVWDGVLSAISIASMVNNTVAGGSVTFRRCSIDGQYAQGLVQGRSCYERYEQVLWNEDLNTNLQFFKYMVSSVQLEAHTHGFYMSDCRLYQRFGLLIGSNTATDCAGLSNWMIERCHFYRSDLYNPGNAQMIALGDADSVNANHTVDLTIRWCRFRGLTDPALGAGNECVYIYRPTRCVMEYNWTDQCSEDAYEIQEPRDGCHIRYSGGGAVGSLLPGQYVNGNMTDFYAQGTIWTGTTNCSVHHIWGTCRGDAVTEDSCCSSGSAAVSIDHIYANNVGGGFAQNPTYAVVRLMSRGANSHVGVSVGQNMSAESESFDGRKVLLTHIYDSGTGLGRTGTIAAGGNVIALSSAVGFSANDLIMIECDETSSGGTRYKHFAVQQGAPSGSNITISPAMPAGRNATARRCVRSAPVNAGSVTWSEWDRTNDVWVTRTGTDGVVSVI